MARSVNEIQELLIAGVQAEPELAQLTSTSKRAIWRLWTFVQAACIALFEQLMDILVLSIETTVSRGTPATAEWIQDMVFKFQYDAANPQIIQFIDYVPSYPVVDESLRIVTRCSVKTTQPGRVVVKVAKEDVPEALSAPELSSLQDFLGSIGVAGVFYVAESGNPDKMYIDADIYYKGQYSAVIQANVEAAINAYFADLPFNGAVKITELETAIKQVEGVSDVVFNNIRARKDSTAFASASYLVQNKTQISRLWNTLAGYIVPETTAGQTLADSLNYISE